LEQKTIIEQKEVAIAVAGEAALGTVGLLLAVIAALFSTGSAINATLFATARLTWDVAQDKELPQALGHENQNGIPDRAVLIIGGTGALLAIIGSLETLVEAASLVFLFTFATINTLAFQQIKHRRWVFGAGAAGASVAGAFLCWRLMHVTPFALGLLAFLVLIATVGRPFILRHS
jgi:amino acid transporter